MMARTSLTSLESSTVAIASPRSVQWLTASSKASGGPSRYHLPVGPPYWDIPERGGHDGLLAEAAAHGAGGGRGG